MAVNDDFPVLFREFIDCFLDRKALFLAFEMLTRVVAAEQGARGIAAITIRPGVIDTPMQEFMRAQPPDRVPTVGMFRQFHDSGQLVAPDVTAAKIVDRLVLAPVERGRAYSLLATSLDRLSRPPVRIPGRQARPSLTYQSGGRSNRRANASSQRSWMPKATAYGSSFSVKMISSRQIVSSSM